MDQAHKKMKYKINEIEELNLKITCLASQSPRRAGLLGTESLTQVVDLKHQIATFLMEMTDISSWSERWVRSKYLTVLDNIYDSEIQNLIWHHIAKSQPKTVPFLDQKKSENFIKYLQLFLASQWYTLVCIVTI